MHTAKYRIALQSPPGYPPGRGGFVDGALNGRRIECCPVAFGAIIPYVKNLDLGSSYAGQRENARKPQRIAASEHMILSSSRYYYIDQPYATPLDSRRCTRFPGLPA